MCPAEGMGFEPMNPCGLAVFKTVAIDLSATPPGIEIVSDTGEFDQSIGGNSPILTTFAMLPSF